MLACISTTSALIVVDTDRVKAWTLNSRDGVFYGLATNGKTLFVVARQAPYGQDLRGRRGQDNVILGYDTRLEPERLPKPERVLKDAHQCAFFDGCLWVMNTAENSVAVWDGRKWSEWLPFGDTRSLENPDTHHLNSLNANASHIALIGNKGGAGTVFLFDRDSRAATGEIEIGGGAHTAWYDDGWRVMASKVGEIRGDGSTPRFIGSYLRGYACDGVTRALGISETNARAFRATSTARIAVYDMDWTLQRTITIEGVGMVHDIHTLCAKDLSRPDQPRFDFHHDALDRLETVALH